MRKISELKTEKLVYNHIVYNHQEERHFAKHSHPLVEMIYVMKGEVAYTIEDEKFVAQAGDLILIKPYSYHYFSVVGQSDYEKIGVLFSPSELSVDAITTKTFLRLPCETGRIRDLFEKLGFYYHNCPERIFKDLLQALSKEIVINIELFYQQHLITKHDAVHPLLQRALAYVNEHLFSISTVRDLAKALSVSEGYLKVLFTDQMKIPPKKYITEKKMLKARTLVLNGVAPTQVAIQCGFTNYVTFYRLYVKLFGVKPLKDAKRQ